MYGRFLQGEGALYAVAFLLACGILVACRGLSRIFAKPSIDYDAPMSMLLDW